MRALDVDDLRSIVTDPGELAKGARVLDEGGLTNLARHGERIYADASGMMAMPYKVMCTVGEKVSARCTCMAARTRPFCKHAAALLVAWARAPEAFAESEGPPAGAPDAPRKRRIKKGKKDQAALFADGAGRVIALVRELAVTGVATTGEGRADALHRLAAGLRDGGLRRLGGRVHRLADRIAGASEGDAIDGDAHADLLADLLFTARKIEKHVAGEALDERHVEELIGKTWRKTDRAPIEQLDLVEIAGGTTITADGFVVRVQRFVDLATATHYADKQIVPQFLARRTAPRPSLGGQRARGARGSLYPGYAPRRLDLEDRGDVIDVDDAALAPLCDAALPGAAAALAALQEHRRDVFAPDALPVAVRVDAIVADGARLRAVDADDAALHLPASPALEDQLAGALRGARLCAIVGDLVLDRALPVLVPLALVIEDEGGRRALRRIVDVAPAPTADDGHWAAQARAAGASSAAVSLAEVRGEIGDLLARGVASFTARAVAPLAARLAELGLERPGALLASIAELPEAERLDDVVRVHQVLGVALTRVLGVTRVDRAPLAPVPGCPSLLAAPDGPGRWSALIAAARALDDVPDLLAAVHPWWSHGWMAPEVAARVARVPGAVDAARAVLADARAGRAARRTAIRILVAIDPQAAPRHVAHALGAGGDVALGSFALDTIDAARESRGDPEAAGHRRTRRHVARDLARTLRDAGTADDRRRAALALGDLADDVAGAALRAAWIGDSSSDVREAAALALGRRGDAAAVDTFVAQLDARGDDARGAALALAASGDSRGAPALVAALAAGWRPPLVAECLRLAGTVVLPSLRAAVAAEPALGRRKIVKELLA